MLRLILAALVLLACQACTTGSPLASQVDEALLGYSDEKRELRRARADVPLEKRIEMIESDLKDTIVEVGEGRLAPRHIRHDGSKGPVHLETNAAILSALAAKYAVTGDPEAKAFGSAIIKGIMALDSLSGQLDGFVPRYADAATLEPADATTHSNAYTQLLFAYVVANKHFGRHDDIERHVSLIYQAFAADDFALRHVDGSYVQRADLNRPLMAFNARRVLDRRLLDEAAYQLGDAEARMLVEQHRWTGPMLGPIHVRILANELPTPSSSWLNLQAMTALNYLGSSYHDEVISLAAKYERDNNPFFRTLASLSGADEDLVAIMARIAEYPYPVTSSGIINSHRPEIMIAAPLYRKFEAVPDSVREMPLYELEPSTYLWKRRSLKKVDSMPDDEPATLLGHDLYQAYWFLRLAKKKHSVAK